MKYLKVWQKLALMGFLLMIPFGFAVFTVISSTRALSADLEQYEGHAVPVAELQRRVESFRNEVKTTRAISALGICVVALIGLWVVLDFTRPLGRVMTIANEIAEGDLSVNVASESRGEERGVGGHEEGHGRARNRILSASSAASVSPETQAPTTNDHGL